MMQSEEVHKFGLWVHGMSLRPCRKQKPTWLHVWPDSGSKFFPKCDENHTPPSHDTHQHDAHGHKLMRSEDKQDKAKLQNGRVQRKNPECEKTGGREESKVV